MTRGEVIDAAAAKSSEARIKGNRRAYLERLTLRVLAAHELRGTGYRESHGVSRPRAQVIGKLMMREGIVKSHFERVPHRRGHAKKVLERL